MFSNRSIQVKLVKAPETEGDDPETTNLADLAYIAHESGGKAIKGVGALFATYMALDTLRQIAIHTAQVKIK